MGYFDKDVYLVNVGVYKVYNSKESWQIWGEFRIYEWFLEYFLKLCFFMFLVFQFFLQCLVNGGYLIYIYLQIYYLYVWDIWVFKGQ